MSRYLRSTLVVVLDAWRGRVRIDAFNTEAPGFFFHDQANRDWWRRGQQECYYYNVRRGRIYEHFNEEVYVQRPHYDEGSIMVNPELDWAPTKLELLITSLTDSKVESSHTLQGLKAWGFDVKDLKLVRNYCGGVHLTRNDEDVLNEFVQAASK